jgi:hypothetical protein
MATQTKATTDLEEIRRFAEGCEAVPATVRDTMEGDEPGVLTLDFLGHGAGEESLEHIGWDAWYEKFESAGLAFLYQERKADGEPSTFFKLVDRDTADDLDVERDAESHGTEGTTSDSGRAAGDTDDEAGSGATARVRATVGTSGAGSGRTLRATLTSPADAQEADGQEDGSDADRSVAEPPAPGESRTTTDLDEIRRFAEECDAVPATVRDTMEGDEPGVLTLDFLGHGAGEESLEHLAWDTWYEKFNAAKLALLYQQRKADGEPSTFFRLVDRDNVDE